MIIIDKHCSEGAIKSTLSAAHLLFTGPVITVHAVGRWLEKGAGRTGFNMPRSSGPIRVKADKDLT